MGLKTRKRLMRLKFTKMHGLGNDFVVIDAVNQRLCMTRERARRLANRKFGVGCDQILLVEKAASDDADFNYRILNADGGEVEQCGNGARCFAIFVRRHGLTDKESIRVRTSGALMTLQTTGGDEVTVDMGIPEFEPQRIPFLADEQSTSYELDINGSAPRIAALAVGNPHAVQLVNDVDSAPVGSLGPLIESHHRFPNGVNAGFMQVVDRNRVRVRVYERGTGETLACGSGACAAVVAAREWGVVDEEVTVELRGGSLTIKWLGRGEPVLMTGTATHVFNGEIDLE
jgi:diaminopimelate epimerase